MPEGETEEIDITYKFILGIIFVGVMIIVLYVLLSRLDVAITRPPL